MERVVTEGVDWWSIISGEGGDGRGGAWWCVISGEGGNGRRDQEGIQIEVKRSRQLGIWLSRILTTVGNICTGSIGVKPL